LIKDGRLSSKIRDAGNAFDLIIPEIVKKLMSPPATNARKTIIDPSTMTGKVRRLQT
jgi:hypothetical protein